MGLRIEKEPNVADTNTMLYGQFEREEETVSTGAGAQPGQRNGGGLAATVRWRRKLHRLARALLPVISLLLLSALVLVPLGLFAWLLFFTDTFQIQSVTVVDAREHTSAAVHQLVSERVARLPLRDNIFLVDPLSLERVILLHLPQVRTVHVTRKLPGTIKVIIQEKEPSFLLLSGGRYYFVDGEGIAYEEARLEHLPGVVLPTVKNDDRAARVLIGTAVVEHQFVQFIGGLAQLLPERVAAQVAEIHIPSLAAREAHVLLTNNWRILFDSTRPAAVQMTVLETLLRESISADEQAVLEYVDLRVPNRVYYRTALAQDERE